MSQTAKKPGGTLLKNIVMFILAAVVAGVVVQTVKTQVIPRYFPNLVGTPQG